MTDQPNETAQEPLHAPGSLNGDRPAIETATPGEIARDVRIVKRTLEDVDVRLQGVQIAVAIGCALTLLVLALELRRLRAAAA